MPQPAKRDTSHAHGHRERLRQRLLQGDESALQDYELLEILLFAAHPRSDTKPYAKALIKRFGSLNDVIKADVSELTQVDGIGDAAAAILKAVQHSAARMLQHSAKQRPVIQSWLALLDYCRSRMGHLRHEEVRALYLDHQNQLLEDAVLQRGTVNSAAIYPREVAKAALLQGASSIILVHNHPTGNPTPSEADIEMTARVREALESVDVKLHDHVIIAGDTYFSFRSQGILR